ncbi:MAG: hypothetical protein LBR56_04220 [Sporomusaceae bacterium]|nr:hypothetical protein [Sporomusaceae bacterium]
MKGRLSKIPNGYYSYDISEADQSYIFKFADVLTKQFGFSTHRPPVCGLDGVYWDIEKENIILTLGWDIWSGVFVFARCVDGNQYVCDFADFYNNLLGN